MTTKQQLRTLTAFLNQCQAGGFNDVNWEGTDAHTFLEVKVPGGTLAVTAGSGAFAPKVYASLYAGTDFNDGEDAVVNFDHQEVWELFKLVQVLSLLEPGALEGRRFRPVHSVF